MNLICIDENTYAYFQQWNRNIVDKVMSAKPYFEKCTVTIKECPEYILYVTACVKNNIPKQKFSLKYNKKQIVKGMFHKSPEQSDCDLKIDYQIVERNIDSQQMLDNCLEAIEYMIDSYINANAFLWYGNYLDRDKREFSAIGKTIIKIRLSYSDHSRISFMLHRSVIIAVLKVYSKLEDISEDIRQDR